MEFPHDVEQSTAAKVDKNQPPAPPPRKYISMFQVDGVPILPPLMTAEKRRQMQKIREKAMKVEKRLEERHAKRLHFSDILEERVGDSQIQSQPETPHSICSGASAHSGGSGSGCGSAASTSGGSVSQRSFDLEAAAVKHQQDQLKQDSLRLLKSLKLSEGERSPSAHADKSFSRRIEKLQKSETIIYDNRTSTTHLLSTGTKQEQLGKEQVDKNKKEVSPKVQIVGQGLKPVHFALERIKRRKSIPSICVNPPTPSVDARGFSDMSTAKGTKTTRDGGESQELDSSFCSVKSGSDESFETNTKCTNSSGSRAAKDFHILQKITQAFQSSNTNIPIKTRTNGGAVTPKSARFAKPPQRSATSPQLKLTSVKCCDAAASIEISLDCNNASSSENGLVRSNSFTLSGPSKVLLDHIRKQQSQTDNRKSTTQIPNNNNTTSSTTPRAGRTCPSSSATRDTVESKAKRVQKAVTSPTPPRSQSRPCQISKNGQQSHSSPGVGTAAGAGTPGHAATQLRSKRSPYELKLCGSSKLKLNAQSIKKSNSQQQVQQHQSQQVQTKQSLQSVKTPPHSKLSVDLLNDIELEHRQKFLQLIAQQQAEQQRLQQMFEAQQQQLLQQLSSEMDKINEAASKRVPSPSAPKSTHQVNTFHVDATGSPPPSTKSVCISSSLSPTKSLGGNSSIMSECSISFMSGDLPSMDTSNCSTTLTQSSAVCKSTNTNNNNNNTNNRCTPRRCLFSQDEHPPTSPTMLSTTGGGGDSNSNTTALPSTNKRFQQHLENERRFIAATKINAWTRGYLVRRLFQTEQVQRIVQTIRDTLIFVLNLHMETAHDPAEANTPANIRLKARLLQQLSSASRTLYLVFFQTSIKERMEIIARDRKRIKTKLLHMNMKRSPRLVG